MLLVVLECVCLTGCDCRWAGRSGLLARLGGRLLGTRGRLARLSGRLLKLLRLLGLPRLLRLSTGQEGGLPLGQRLGVGRGDLGLGTRAGAAG